MRLFATGLLVAMAALYLVARQFVGLHPAMGYVLAFAEAAMVGGLADWFAVTALFRRPLGLPIPHTAIVPENKDRIADTMATFLRTNFLTPQVVARARMRQTCATVAAAARHQYRGCRGRLAGRSAKRRGRPGARRRGRIAGAGA